MHDWVTWVPPAKVCEQVDPQLMPPGELVETSADERAEMAARAVAGGLGYGEVKKDLLARLTARFAPMRERRAALAARPAEVEDVLADGARRARAIAKPVLDACREAAGLGASLRGKR